MDNIATLKGLKCPRCGSEQLRVTGTKGALGAAIATGAAFGAVGSMVAGSSAASNRTTEALQYKCSACGEKFQSMPLIAPPEDILPAPCTVTITRESSFVGAAVPQIVYINGVKLGPVKNGKSLVFMTNNRYNVMFVTDQYGVAFPDEYRFEAKPGENVSVRFCRKFLGAQGGPAAVPPAQASPRTTTTATPAKEAAFCYKCGEALWEGAAFCYKCGEPRFVLSTEETPHAQPAPMSTAAFAPPDAPRPERAIWTAGILLASWFVSYILQDIFSGLLLFNLDFGCFITMALLGASLFLFTERDMKYKIFGGVGGLLSIFMTSANISAVNINSRTYGAFGLGDIFDLSEPLFINYLGRTLVLVLLAFGAAFLCGILFKAKPEKDRRRMTGLICAGVYTLPSLLWWLIGNIRVLGRMNFPNIVSSFSGYIFDAAVIYLSFIFLFSLCGMPRRGVRLRGLGLVWGWIGAVGMFLSIITVFYTAMGTMNGLVYVSNLMLAIAGLVGYIMLLCRRRMGLYIIIGAAALALGAQFSASLTGMFYSASRYSSLLFGSIFGAVNPIFAWLAVRSADKKDACREPQAVSASPTVRHKVSGFHKFAAIFNTAVGAILLVPVMININDSGETAFVITFLLISAAFIGFGVWSIVAQHSAAKPYPTWMKVVNIVLFSFGALLFVIMLIGLAAAFLW